MIVYAKKNFKIGKNQLMCTLKHNRNTNLRELCTNFVLSI